jgi:hypothetical protein
MFQRTGTGCRGTTMPALWLAIAVVAQLYIVAMLVRMCVVLLRAWRRGLLKRNFCTFAALGAVATELALATYNFGNVWQCAGGTSKLVDGVLFVVGKTVMFVLFFTLVVTWRLQAFSVAEQSFAAGKELADRRRELRLAYISFSVLVVGVPAFELTGRPSWTAALSLLFAGVGTYNFLSAVRQLRAVFDASVISDAEQHASAAGQQAPVDGSKPARAPPSDLQRFLSRLVLCRRDGVLGMTLAALSMGYYVFTSEEHSSTALTPSFISFINFHATKVIIAWSVWGFSRLAFGPLQDQLATATRAAARAAGRAKVRPGGA